MVALLEGKVDTNMLKQLIEIVKEARDRNEQTTIYFNSQGGDMTVIDPIVEVLDSHSDIIELVAFCEISSSAFIIFFKTTAPKRIMEDTVGCIHNGYMNVDKDSMGNLKNEYASFLYKELRANSKHVLTFYKNLGVTEVELAQIGSGKDIFINSKRLKEFLNGKTTKQGKPSSNRAVKAR